MTTVLQALFADLLDDAALFPPGDASMAQAVAAHRELRARWGAPVGPLVVAASRLEELLGHADGEPLRLAVISPPGDVPAALSVAGSRRRLRLRLESVELPVIADAASARDAVRLLDRTLPARVSAALELPRTGERNGVLAALAGTRYRAKLRTGGMVSEAFPDTAELAAALQDCVRAGVPVKCTAGLHRAVRHTDPVTGFRHHGFLNVLLAVDALVNGAPVARDWLDENDATCLAVALRSWSTERAARVREAFISFGTCNVTEPLADLVGLRLIPARAAA